MKEGEQIITVFGNVIIDTVGGVDNHTAKISTDIWHTPTVLSLEFVA
jgi:hypothetical protein